MQAALAIASLLSPLALVAFLAARHQRAVTDEAGEQLTILRRPRLRLLLIPAWMLVLIGLLLVRHAREFDGSPAWIVMLPNIAIAYTLGALAI